MPSKSSVPIVNQRSETETPPVIPIVIAIGTKPAEQELAQELADDLRQIYLNQKFTVSTKLPTTGKCILMGWSGDPRIASRLSETAPTDPESFLVATSQEDSLECGIIAGADARGIAYGVYALLGKLGWGFYLSYDSKPSPRLDAFSWDGWQIKDKPLLSDRLVFEWHNFLSGCSTWDLPQWQSWVRQSRKMGYNAIMVHAYGNNPMAAFEFNGKSKPLGYLSTTVRGRDWATEHVNDVRRLCGGEVFSEPVFGAAAAQAPEDQREQAAQKLMHEVFSDAARQSMNIFFATDVDTVEANPQELIETLPADSRFLIRIDEGEKFVWLANPDTPAGYEYYIAQAKALIAAYPDISCIALWIRGSNRETAWGALNVANMPPDWRTEYQKAVTESSAAQIEPRSECLFGISKVTRAWQRALKELGLDRVRLALGSWNFTFLPSSDRFIPEGVTLIGLDYQVLFGKSALYTNKQRQELAGVGAHRPLIPVIWAHHDDGDYIGRSYTPYTNFHAKLAETKASGFGIIHWTTRPLDLFFSSHIRQVWARTENEPIAATCHEMAVKSFGPLAGDKMGAYLEQWVTDAPIFGRETLERFVELEHQLKHIPKVIGGCEDRKQLIDTVDFEQITPAQMDRVRYWRGLEDFIAAFFQTQDKLQEAEALWKSGQLELARTTLASCKPKTVVEQYARTASLGGITRGEQGVIVSLNTRWLSRFLWLQEVLRMEPARIIFSATSHDPLAGQPGEWTFTIDRDGRWWQTLGAKETGAETFALPDAGNEMGCNGIQSDQPITLQVGPLFKSDLPAGNYRLHLFLLDPDSTEPGQHLFSVAVSGVSEKVDIFKEAGIRGTVVEKVYPITLEKPGRIELTLIPITGKSAISGILVEPVE